MRDRLPFALGINNCRSVDGVVRWVKRAEELGAEIAFISEDVNCRDAFQLAAVCAGQTERIGLATGVVNPFTRNPTSLAMAAATLDEVSAGRAILGMGTSSPGLIRDQMGIPAHGSVGVMREATEIIRGLLAGETVTYAGERFRYQEAKLDFKPLRPAIPLFYAAMGPQMLRLAGQLADGVLLNVGASVEYVRWAVQQIRAGIEEAGRAEDAVKVAAWLSVYVTDDRAEGLRRARTWLTGVLSVPRQGELLLEQSGIDTSMLGPIRERFNAYPDRGDRQAAAAYVPDDVAERLTLIGTPAEVRERVREYRAVGVELPVVGSSVLEVLSGEK